MRADEVDKGMVVTLISGGPPMTVRAIYGDQVYCEWFSDIDRRLGTFDLKTLVRYTDPAAPAAEGAPPK